MTRVSRKQLNKKALEEINSHFLYLVASLKNSQEIRNFLYCFLTEEEKTMLSKRLTLVMMAQKGYSSGTIQQALNVSYETVRSYTIRHKLNNAAYKKTVDRLIKREGSQQFWKKVDSLLKPVDILLRSGTDMKARSKLYRGDWS